MIARLTGTVVEKELMDVVLDVHGVGYELSVPLSTGDKLPDIGNEVTLLTEMVVREDDIHLYGFATKAERTVFRLLTSAVSGVGPKLALSVLSAMGISDFAQAVLQSDLKRLSKVPGIGKRTAERMVVELRDKAAGMLSAEGLSEVVASAAEATSGKVMSADATDAIKALETLGFKHDQAEKAVVAVLETVGADARAETIIRRALGMLNS